MRVTIGNQSLIVINPFENWEIINTNGPFVPILLPCSSSIVTNSIHALCMYNKDLQNK